ncbi:MAG: universal stress protein [Myxococcaceae bacterium]|nr:universal stress protein [Myxococcaceae bacterium]
MKRFLVAVDGSDASVKAVRAVVSLAEPLGAHVTLLYVVPPMVGAAGGAWAPLDEIHASEVKHGEKVLAEVVAALGTSALSIEPRAVVGPPVETIVSIAADEGFDLIAVGSTGKGAVKRLLLGSTADRLVHLSEKPVLVVR